MNKNRLNLNFYDYMFLFGTSVLFIWALILVILRKPIPFVVFVSEAVLFFVVLVWSLFKYRALSHMRKNGRLNIFRIVLNLILIIVNFVSGIMACKIVTEISIEPIYINIFIYFILSLNIGFLLNSIADLTSQLLLERHRSLIGIDVAITLFQIIQLFAIVYAYIYSIDNTSFAGISNDKPFLLFIDFMYFSTITFTTLGFGDITPVSSAAKTAVMFEVLLFVIYISIILLNLANNRNRNLSSEVSSNAEISSDSNSHEGESSENDN